MVYKTIISCNFGCVNTFPADVIISLEVMHEGTPTRSTETPGVAVDAPTGSGL
jgi:hypothetical protein